jgi:hypothetical protein
MFGRVQIEAHHIFQLVLEVRILAELDGPDSVGLQPMGSPDPLHQRRIRPQVPSQGTGGPVGGVGRGRLGRRLQNACDQRLAGLGGPPAAWRILREARETLGGRSGDAQRPTVCRLVSRAAALCWLSWPSAANKAILAWSTRRAGVRRPRAHCVSCWRTSSVT